MPPAVASPPQKRLAHIVHVEDEQETQLRVARELPATNMIELQQFQSPEQLWEAKLDGEVDLLILDSFFDKADRTQDLIEHVTQRWPGAKLCFLARANSPKLQVRGGQEFRFLHKDQFEKNPNMLLEVVDEVLDRPRVLYSVTGHVIGVRKPHVDVTLNEESTKGPQRVDVLMPYWLFESEGILERGMRFMFRTYRQGSKVCADVVPLDDEDEEDQPAKLAQGSE